MPTTELSTGTNQAVSSSAVPAAVPIRVAAFTGSRTVSSPRFRVRQYVPYLDTLGVQITEFIARLGSWPPRSKGLRPLWFPGTLLDRLPGVLKSYQYDVTLLQREMVSTLATLERFTRRPRIFDVDDAVWLNRNSEKNFGSLVRMCDGVICGNSFLEEKVRQWQSETIVLPTAVDSDRKPQFRILEGSQVEYVPWSPENEVRTIQEMFLGLMPAEDSLWARGKCSYKMLLYMACGVPVVVSPVGMNSEVLSLGNVGFGAAKAAEWIDSINWLLDNPDQGQQMGRVGRRVVEERFSLHVLAPRLADYLRKFRN